MTLYEFGKEMAFFDHFDKVAAGLPAPALGALIGAPVGALLGGAAGNDDNLGRRLLIGGLAGAGLGAGGGLLAGDIGKTLKAQARGAKSRTSAAAKVRAAAAKVKPPATATVKAPTAKAPAAPPAATTNAPTPKKVFKAHLAPKAQIVNKKGPQGPEPHAGGVEIKAKPKAKAKAKAAPPAKTPAKWASFDPKQAAATLLAKHTA